MIPAATPTSVAPPDDPVRSALDDSRIRDDLLIHARAVIGPGAADDDTEAVQEAAARAWQSRGAFDPANGTVTAWLHGILSNVLRECVRKRRRRPIQPPDDPGAWDRLAAGLVQADGAADQDAVTVLLARLLADHRAILELRYREGLNHAEIAARVGISVGCARVRLCRALSAARKIAGVAPGEVGR